MNNVFKTIKSLKAKDIKNNPFEIIIKDRHDNLINNLKLCYTRDYFVKDSHCGASNDHFYNNIKEAKEGLTAILNSTLSLFKDNYKIDYKANSITIILL